MTVKIFLIAFLVAIAGLALFQFKRGMTPRDLSNEKPDQVFESFVCSPIPSSVRNIKASGIIAFAGGGAGIEFQLDPRDHDDLVERGKFRLMDDRAPQWIKEFQPVGFDGNLLRYVRTNEGMTESALFITEDNHRAWFREIQF
jgi:hypothetical protein